MMSKINNKNKSLILLSIILMYLLVYRTIILNKFLFYEEFITSSFFIILVGLSILILGVRKNKINNLDNTIFAYVLTMLCIYFSIIYLLGFFRGFLKNSYSLELNDVFMNTICPLINIICLETIRFVLLQSNKKNRKMINIITISFIFFEILYYLDLYDLNTIDGIFECLCMLILKTIVENILLTYLSINFNFKTSILYRSITTLYVYIMPIVPDLGNILNAIFNVLFPFILWTQVSKINYETNERTEQTFKKNVFGFKDVVIYTTLICTFVLVSNLFPLKLVSIASGSMTPNIKVGDAVLVNGLKDKQTIKIGDIIAFKHDGKVIVHRVIDIKEENNEKIYKTKGDNNNSADGFNITNMDIEGVVLLNIPFVGYPSLFLSNMKAG